MNSFKYFLIVLCSFFCVVAHAETPPPASDMPAKIDACSTSQMSRLTESRRLEAMQAPLAEAIATLDNSKVEFSSPTLASGKLSYLTVTPAFDSDLKHVCVLGYFYFERDDGKVDNTEPLDIDHVETVKVPDPKDAKLMIDASRIYFRAPSSDNFSEMNKDKFWQFWAKHEHVILKFAAFSYDPQTDQKMKASLGREIPVSISQTKASVFAAFLFCLICYLLAALTVGFRTDDHWIEAVAQGKLRFSGSKLRLFFHRISPWYMVGSSGQASLSQLQMLLFTLIVATLLFYQWMRTGLLQDISTDLLYLMGISTLGAGGTQLANSVKKTLDPKVYAYLQQLGWFTAPISGGHYGALPSQLLLTNNRFDIYKFQMLVFTIVISAYVVASGADQLGNIRISDTLLMLMGLSQGVYVGGNAATDNTTPLQDQLRGMQTLQESYLAAKDDPATQAAIAQQFEQAAQEAAEMFKGMFRRDVPEAMLKITRGVGG